MLLPNARGLAFASAEGAGVRLADDLPGSRSIAKRQPPDERDVSAKPSVGIQDCCAAHRLQARLLRPLGRSANALRAQADESCTHKRMNRLHEGGRPALPIASGKSAS